MDFKEFEQHIKAVIEANETSFKIMELFECEGIVVMYDALIDSVTDLLERHFEDEEQWISYWMWELNFGKDYEDGKVQIEGNIVKLKTIEDLYNILKD